MAEYINREEYCEKYCRCNNEHCGRESCPIWKAPTADVALVVHGRWIGGKYDPGTGDYMEECSHCGVFSREYWKPYCSECGAKMDGVDDG